MSRELISTTQDYSVQANWTAWADGIHNAILNRGWLATSDTGQVNTATVTVPTSGADAGYRLYKTNDGVGDQFFLKIVYGRSTSVRHPSSKWQLGTGSDGAGNLTGNLSNTFHMIGPLNDPGTVVWRALVAGDAGALTYYRSIDTTSPAAYCEAISFRRTVDSSGTISTRGMEIWAWNSDLGSGQNIEFVPGPSYSSVCWGLEPGARAASPLRIASGTGTLHYNWTFGKKSYVGLTFTIHELDSNYPNWQVATWDGQHPVPSFMINGIYRLTFYGTTREYIFHNGGIDAGVSGACWAFCIA